MVFPKGFASLPRLSEAEDSAVVAAAGYWGPTSVVAGGVELLVASALLDTMTEECQLKRAGGDHGRTTRVFHRSAVAEGC